MGYSFAGLLLVDDDERARRAGRWYLVLLIVADLILFEALLIAGDLTDDLGFATVAGITAPSPSSTFYLWMVITGFTLKAGFWPLHQWLPLAYRSAPPAVALLLWLVPVATGLLGLLRWIPLGTVNDPVLGKLLLATGAGGVVYALAGGLRQPRWQRFPLYLAMLATGATVMGLGIGLVDPATWHRYGALTPVIITTIGLGLMIITRFCRTASLTAAADTGSSDDRPLWAESWAEATVCWGQRTGFDTLPAWRASWVKKWHKVLQVTGWHRLMDTDDAVFQRWPVAITLCLLLGILSVVLLLLVE
jgi:formate hydrogenlyase subunit 3/multisubunit Na+/H+ antiporter MnhD subunit